MKEKILAVAVTLFASAMILAGNYSAQADDGAIPITTTTIPIIVVTIVSPFSNSFRARLC